MANTHQVRTLRIKGASRRVRCDSTSLPVVEKDILRVGHWKPGGDSWHVSPKTLRNICDQFKRYRANGNRVPWIVDHEGGADQRIGDVVALRVDGDRLVARCQVTDKRYSLSFGDKPGDTSSQEVSVEVYEPWEDGAGNRYPIALTHLANVINPVVTGQQPFKRILSLRKKVRRMAEETVAEDTGEEIASAAVSLDALLSKLATALGVPVPDTVVDEASLFAWLDGLMTTPGEEETAEDAAAVEEISSDVVPVPTDSPMYMSLKKQNDDLRRRLALVEKSEREAYHAKLDQLAKDNKITPAEARQYKADADAIKTYRLSLLAPLDRLTGTAVHTGGVAKRMGAGSQEGGHDKGPMTRERAKEIAKAAYSY